MKPKTTVLIIDDDRKLTGLLEAYLGQFGLEVRSAATPDDGMSELRRRPPSIVVLDLMLPGRDGFAVCREIRRESEVPILMLTARGDLTDRVAGLELGADDYMPKPFEPRELVARIQTILRRTGATSRAGGPVLKALDLELDLRAHGARFRGKSLELTTAEFELLSLFMSHPGTALSRDEIMERIRGIDWEAFNRSIDVAISRLRQKLEDDPKNPRWFRTIRGTGYLFIPKVEEVTSSG